MGMQSKSHPKKIHLKNTSPVFSKLFNSKTMMHGIGGRPVRSGGLLWRDLGCQILGDGSSEIAIPLCHVVYVEKLPEISRTAS